MPYLTKPKKKKNYPKHNVHKDIAKIYNTPQWKNLRASYIMYHPLCESCLNQGKTTPAQEVHHIRPISTGMDEWEMKSLAYDPTNLMALCSECHHKIHQMLKNNKKINLN